MISNMGIIFLLLMSLRVTANEIAPPSTTCSVSRDTEHNGLHFDCRNRGLTEIPRIFPKNTTSINLSNNNIEVVRNNSFSSLGRLRYLNLEHNVISRVELHGFMKLWELLDLRISRNNMFWNGSVFDNLASLTSLGIDMHYSGRIFQRLKMVTRIEIQVHENSPDSYFDGFHFLPSLRSVTISGYMKLKNDTFVSLSDMKIETLNILGKFSLIEIDTFSPLKYLNNLSLINPRCGVKKALTCLHGLVGRNLTKLEISGLDVVTSLPQDLDQLAIDNNTMIYLKEICVNHLSLAHNNLLFIDFILFVNSVIGKCVQYFDVSKNSIRIIDLNWVFYFGLMSNLKHFDISAQNIMFPSSYGSQPTISTNMSRNGFIFRIPQHLRYLNMSYIARDFGQFRYKMTFINASLLKVVDISYNDIWIIGELTGLDNVTHLDLSGNRRLKMPNTFFDNVPSIQTLRLAYGSCPQNVMTEQGKRFFSSLTKLSKLDLSGNQLLELPDDLFSANQFLEYIDLSRNSFISVPVNIELTLSLKVIDLSFNSLGSVDTIIRYNVERQYEHTNNRFFLNLHHNIISCGCENFPFLAWLSETIVYDAIDKNLTCLTPGGLLSNTGTINKSFIKFWRSCIGSYVLVLTGLLFSLMICSLFVALFITTNMTKISNVLINVLRRQIARPKRRDFTRDVYVSYAKADYRWVCHELCPGLQAKHLSLYIYDRDSVPGESIADQIAETIPRCWKTIIYFSDNYPGDHEYYTDFSMLSAIHCVDNLSPEKIILLIPEDENPRIPNCLLQVVPETCIFRIPVDTTKYDPIWREISERIFD